MERSGVLSAAVVTSQTRIPRWIHQQPAVLAAHLHVLALDALLSKLCLIPIDSPLNGALKALGLVTWSSSASFPPGSREAGPPGTSSTITA